MADLAAADVVLHVVFREQFFQRRVIGGGVLELGVKAYRHHLKGNAQILPQAGKAHRESHAVLAAGHAHAHLVAGRDHAVFLNGLAHESFQTLHVAAPFHIMYYKDERSMPQGAKRRFSRSLYHIRGNLHKLCAKI